MLVVLSCGRGTAVGVVVDGKSSFRRTLSELEPRTVEEPTVEES